MKKKNEAAINLIEKDSDDENSIIDN